MQQELSKKSKTFYHEIKPVTLWLKKIIKYQLFHFKQGDPIAQEPPLNYSNSHIKEKKYFL